MSLFRSSPRYAPGDLIEVAGAPVRLKVDARARRVSLRLDPGRREVIATAPSLRRLPEAAAFAAERAFWIVQQMLALPEAVVLTPGALIEVLGQPHRLERAMSRSAAGFRAPLAGLPVIAAMGEGETFTRGVVRALRKRAEAFFVERTAHHAGILDQPLPSVAITDTRARWGSCRPARPGSGEAGAIRYSWRLVLAPHAVADYVAAHECAHLLEANHGPRFWALVRRLYGSERMARAWLRRHGPRLHAVGR